MEIISNQNAKSPEATKISQQLAPWVRYLGLSTSVLAVYGYCVMQGVADALHIEGGSLWGSPSDVLHYAFLGIVSFLSRIPDAISLAALQNMLMQWSYWFYTALIAIFAWVVMRTDRSAGAIEERQARVKNHRLARWMREEFKSIPRYQLALVASTPLVIPAFMVGMWISLVCIGGALALFGLLGISTGLAHVADQKPTNPYCITATAPRDSSAKAVRCVRVRWQADGQTHSETGILVASTSSYALLIKSGSAHGLRVPLNGHAILEAVSQLETAPTTPKDPPTN